MAEILTGIVFQKDIQIFIRRHFSVYRIKVRKHSYLSFLSFMGDQPVLDLIFQFNFSHFKKMIMKQLLKNQKQGSFANTAKKSFAILGILLSLGLYSYAGTNGAQVRAESNFEKVFSNATNVHWNQSGDYFQANCLLEGKQTHVFYNAEGEYLCLTREIEYKDLPENARALISKKYEGYTPFETISFTSKDAGNAFYCSLLNGSEKKVLKINYDASVATVE